MMAEDADSSGFGLGGGFQFQGRSGSVRERFRGIQKALSLRELMITEQAGSGDESEKGALYWSRS